MSEKLTLTDIKETLNTVIEEYKLRGMCNEGVDWHSITSGGWFRVRNKSQSAQNAECSSSIPLCEDALAGSWIN